MTEDDYALPDEVAAFVDGLAHRIGGRRSVRNEVRRELMAHFEDALEECGAADRPNRAAALLTEFGDPQLLGTLIRRAKKRCRPPWERFLIAFLKFSSAALLLLIAAALVQGQVAEKNFREGLAALERKGLIASSSQLRSPRPADTVYFNGPPRESAAAFLLGLNQERNTPLDEVGTVLEPLQNAPKDAAKLVPRMRELTASLRPLLDKARAAAALPPTPMAQVVALTHLDGAPEDVTFPELQAMDLLQALLLDAWVQYSDGKTEEAAGSFECAFQLIEHLRDFPTLISQLIASSAESTAFTMLGWMQAPAFLPEEGSAKLLPHANRAEYERSAMAQALTVESLRGRTLFQGGKEFLVSASSAQTAPLSRRAANWFLAHLYFTPPFRFLSAPDKLGYFEYFQQASQCFDGPYFAMRERCRQIPSAKSIPRTRILTRLVYTAISGGLEIDQAACEAHAALLRTAVHLERYKRLNGQYPPDLAALSPIACPDSYTDPFTGQALHYARSETAFTLDSAGPDIRNAAAPSMRQPIVWGE